MKSDIQRYWIDQPSPLQSLHHYHGTNVIAAPCDSTDYTATIYLLSGDVISMVAPMEVLSPGWVETTTNTGGPSVPEVGVMFETTYLSGFTGTTSATVKRVEAQDDGSFTAVIDHWPGTPKYPDPRIAVLTKALEDLIKYSERQICGHEDTHRGGSIWEICDSCGQSWADDRGGKPEFEWPEEIQEANLALAQVKSQ